MPAVMLIGGTRDSTILTLVFLPALYPLWFRIRPPVEEDRRMPHSFVPAPAS
jgi:Cu/Ag efflux pump CusA